MSIQRLTYVIAACGFFQRDFIESMAFTGIKG